MRYYNLLNMFFIFCCQGIMIRPELLIVQKNNNEYSSLSHEKSTKYGQAIAQILLKYQWPACITSKLSLKEVEELLSPGVAQAEERFIQKKINELVGSSADELTVFFIPQALYDLFCLILYFNDLNVSGQKGHTESMFSNESMKNIQNFWLNLERENPYKKAWIAFQENGRIDFQDILNEVDISPAIVYEKINDAFDKVNGLFFEGKDNAAVYINNALVSFLFDIYPQMKKSRNSIELANFIKSKIPELILLLIERAKNFKNYALVLEDLKNESKSHVVAKIIAIEYEARKLNKALLIRGTDYIKFEASPAIMPSKKTLAGNTLYQTDERNFLKVYAKKKNAPYSISFGNSLFAGAINDSGACAYCYLSSYPGYALLIDKKSYMQHQNQRLFFIPPLTPIAALFASGEFFHARSKAATIFKEKDKKMRIFGLATGGIIDPTGVFLITRDPLLHAELFSKYLIENGRLIQSGDETNSIENDLKFFETIMEAQADVAKYYNFVRNIKPKIDKAILKFRRGRQSFWINFYSYLRYYRT